MAIEIPDKLKQKGIRFVLVEKGGKKPFQQGWQNKVIGFDNVELLSHLNSNGNYGVLGGGEKNLLLLDFDNEKVQNEVVPLLPKTFTVRSGSGLLHKYFFSDKTDSFKIFDEEMNTIADIQGEGKQVVGAGSIHPNGNKYELVDDSEIAFMPYAELKAILSKYDKKPKKEIKQPQFEKPKVDLEDDFLDTVKSYVSIAQVLSDFGIDTTRNPTACPFHSSKGGKCLGFNKDTAHCFHCDGSWNIFSLVKDYKKCDFKETLEYIAKLGGLEKDLEESKKKFLDKKKTKEISGLGIFSDKKQVAEVFYQKQPFFYDRGRLWWFWDKQKFKWEQVDDVDVLNSVSNSIQANTINGKEKTEIIEALQQVGRTKIPKSIPSTWVQFQDEIWDLKTEEKVKATPDYFITNPIPYKVSGNPQTPIMDKIFEEWVGKDYVKTLYQILAYCTLPDYPIHRIFCFIGDGMNGKSCFLRLLRKFIGISNTTTTELDTLLSSRFEITRLYKKLVCMMGETNFNEMNKTSILKKLTGQDTIGFEYKNKTPFDDISYAKILMATNNLPTTTDKTTGFYRRWMIIDFPNKFSEKKDILSDIPEEEYSNLATNCIILLKELLEKREFEKEGSIEERTKKYEDHSDPIEKFMKEYTEEDFGGFIWKFDFEKKLNEWCSDNKFRKMSDVAIGKKMKEKGIEQSQRHSEWLIDGQKKLLRCWIGIKWKGDLNHTEQW